MANHIEGQFYLALSSVIRPILIDLKVYFSALNAFKFLEKVKCSETKFLIALET